MSSVKDPQEKKNLSLARDRRNTYGENAKASRKNIPASKQRSHQTERHAAKAPLQQLRGPISEGSADQAEFVSRSNAIEKRERASESLRTGRLASF
jgi:hypothetical protein